MGDKEFNGDKEGLEFWWEDYEGDIAGRYDDLFANNPHLKCVSYLINLRIRLEGYEDENVNDFVDRILHYTKMKRTPHFYNQNILIVNGNYKFTFLNTSKIITENRLDWEKILEKGKRKLRREYSRVWKEGDDDDENNFTVVWVKLRGYWEDEYRYDDDEEFKRVCNRIKAKFF